MSLRPVAAHLANLLGTNVNFVDDCVGDKVEKVVAAMQPSQVVLLENVRYSNLFVRLIEISNFHVRNDCDHRRGRIALDEQRQTVWQYLANDSSLPGKRFAGANGRSDSHR